MLARTESIWSAKRTERRHGTTPRPGGSLGKRPHWSAEPRARSPRPAHCSHGRIVADHRRLRWDDGPDDVNWVTWAAEGSIGPPQRYDLDGEGEQDRADDDEHDAEMLARHVPPLRRRDSPRDLRPQLLHLALKVGDALLELALVVLEAEDLAAHAHAEDRLD